MWVGFFLAVCKRVWSLWLFQASHSAEDDHKDMKPGAGGPPGQPGAKCPEGNGEHNNQ